MDSLSDPRPPINEEWLARMRSIRPEFLARLFQVFLAEEPERLAKLGAAVAASDLELVCFLAHSLKGAAATMGMERVRDACRALEHAAKAGEAGGLSSQYSAVLQEMEAVFGVMRQDGTSG